MAIRRGRPPPHPTIFFFDSDKQPQKAVAAYPDAFALGLYPKSTATQRLAYRNLSRHKRHAWFYISDVRTRFPISDVSASSPRNTKKQEVIARAWGTND